MTSPPDWRRRDYGPPDHLGQEPTPEAYVAALIACLRRWRRVLKPTGSVFLNIGDSYRDGSLAGVPELVAVQARRAGWHLVNRIVWVKDNGVPEPRRYRLANRHEFIFHLAAGRDFYADLHAFSDAYNDGMNPGDVWRVHHTRSKSDHLAPFPEEIASRAILFACPERVCPVTGRPLPRVLERTLFDLNLERPQARRALEVYRASGLTEDHIRAVQATGIGDAGKALRVQSGTGRNRPEVRRLAAEAKAELGGYFREFTFARRREVGWETCPEDCACGGTHRPGLVLDPFAGCGTTLRAARTLGRRAVGVDLIPPVPTVS